MANGAALQQYDFAARIERNEWPKSWRRTGWKDGVPGTILAAELRLDGLGQPLRELETVEDLDFSLKKLEHQAPATLFRRLE